MTISDPPPLLLLSAPPRGESFADIDYRLLDHVIGAEGAKTGRPGHREPTGGISGDRGEASRVGVK